MIIDQLVYYLPIDIRMHAGGGGQRRGAGGAVGAGGPDHRRRLRRRAEPARVRRRRGRLRRVLTTDPSPFIFVVAFF